MPRLGVADAGAYLLGGPSTTASPLASIPETDFSSNILRIRIIIYFIRLHLPPR